MIKAPSENHGFTVTINTTEDCNLRCKYCYEINKNPKTISFDTVKKFIDVMLTDPDPCDVKNDTEIEQTRSLYSNGIILDAIGGDAFMNIDILDKTYQYFIEKLFSDDVSDLAKTYWRISHIFSVSTNGTLFLKPEVREFCEKWKSLLYPGVSIDGCPEIHDMNRVYADGRGSMADILKSWDWYTKTFPYASKATKSTCSRNSIPYMYDSLRFMHEDLGILAINQNFIMEDTGCTKEDYDLLNKQMEKCVEYVLDHRHKLYWEPLDKDYFAGAHLSNELDWENTGHCGSGSMPCLSIDGNIYPCFRWLNHAQSSDEYKAFSVGNVDEGLIHKDVFRKVRAGAYRANCTKEEKCKTCNCESSCSYCIGGCFSEFKDFVRQTYICELTKIQVKWARIYWDEYNKLEGLPAIDWEEFSNSRRIL